MKKKKDHGGEMPMFYEPSPKEQRRMAAQHAARVAVESNPSYKRKIQRTKNAILEAINKSLKES